MIKYINTTINSDMSQAMELFLLENATPQMEGLEELHNNIMFYLAIILFAVSWITVSTILNYKKPWQKISKDDFNAFLIFIFFLGYIYLIISGQIYAMAPQLGNDIIIIDTSERAKLPGVIEIIQEYKVEVKTARDQIMNNLRIEREQGYTWEDEYNSRRMLRTNVPLIPRYALEVAHQDRLTLIQQQCYQQIDLMKYVKYEEALLKIKGLKPEIEAPYYGFTGRPFEEDGLNIISQVNMNLFHTSTETITTVDPNGTIDSGFSPDAPEGTYQPYGSMLAKKFENDIIYPNGIHGWKAFPDVDKKSTSFLTGFINHHNPNIWKIGSSDCSLTDPEFLAKLKKA